MKMESKDLDKGSKVHAMQFQSLEYKNQFKFKTK